MATHDAWALVCRLFAGGTPILRAALSPREIAALPALGQAVKPTALDQRFVLCPYCHQQRAQVWGGGRRGCSCQCPECGPETAQAQESGDRACPAPAGGRPETGRPAGRGDQKV